MTRFGKYELETLLARGGMAEIFRSTRTLEGGSTVPVCVKRVRPEFGGDREFEEMFLREARIASALDHPNIVKVYEYDRHDGRLFLVMELVDGMDLRHLLRAAYETGLSLPVDFAFHVMRGLLSALDHAQGLRIDGEPRPVIHRDVSPHNILLSMDGEVKLTDFGIAKARGATSATRTGVLKGKLAYLSPEQAGGREVGTGSDLFCAGIVLWEMLNGRRLYSGGSEQEILAKIIKADVPEIPWVSSSIVDFLGRLMSRDLEDRFSTAAEALEAVEGLPLGKDYAEEAARLLRGAVSLQDGHGGTGLITPSRPPESLAGEEISEEEESGLISEGKTRTTLEDLEVPAGKVDARGGGGLRWILVGIAALLAVGVGGFFFGGVFNPGTTTEAPESIVSQQVPLPPAVAGTAEADEIAEPIVQRVYGAGEAVDSGPTPTEQGARTDAETENRTGFLEVNCRPWARVKVDGRDVGTTPIKRLKLPEGKHRVTLTNPPLDYSKTFAVKVSAQKTSRLNKEIGKFRPQ